MSHCPQCGTKAEPGAEACAVCGSPLAITPQRAGGPPLSLRTMVGVAAADLLPKSREGTGPTPGEAAAAHTPPATSRTIVGMPAAAILASAPEAAPRSSPEAQRTLLGVNTSEDAPPLPLSSRDPAPPVVEPPPPDRTLLGVARPGIAPTSPGALVGKDELPKIVAPRRERERERQRERERERERELGDTYGPDEMPVSEPAPSQRSPGRERLAKRRVVLPPLQGRQGRAGAGKRSGFRRAVPVLVTAGACAVAAVLFAVFWRSAPPLTARVRAGADGREALEIECPSCPEGTKVTVGSTSATVAKHVALVPLAVPLALGENRLKVAVDRPGSGRDETMGISVQVSYRLRPDLTALTGERPTVQVVVEASSGTEVEVGGKPVSFKDGPAVHAVDVTADCTGSSDEPATLERRIPYSVKSPEGTTETGVVDVAVGIVPLRIDAPGPSVIIEGETFVLSGRTMKGAEVLAAGRPIPVGGDGTFAQRMGVSSVGATAIEVRAKVAGMAPRIVPIAVRRVEKLEAAAKEMLEGKPLGYAGLAGATEADAGRAVVVSGEVVEARSQNHQTVFLLDVPVAQGCPSKASPCRVRLVHGFDKPAKPGDLLTAYGQLGRPFSVPGAGTVPEVIVAFTLPGLRPGVGGR
jgi:hypothetical protein